MIAFESRHRRCGLIGLPEQLLRPFEQLLPCRGRADGFPLTDEQLQTVMISDVFFRYSDKYDREEIKRGVSIREVLADVLPEDDLSILLEKCETALRQEPVSTQLPRYTRT